MRPILIRRVALRLALIVVASAWFWANHAQAQTNDTDALLQHVRELSQAGKYAEAMPLAKRYAAAIKSKYGTEDDKYATALSWIGHLYSGLGHYAEAQPLYQRALAIDEKALGPKDRSTGIDLSNLAGAYYAQGRYADAEPFYKRALAIDEKALGTEHLTVGARLNNLAELYGAEGRYVEAEPLYQRALAINAVIVRDACGARDLPEPLAIAALAHGQPEFALHDGSRALGMQSLVE
jgi:tetratricopeptide (TPR) repeat protein